MKKATINILFLAIQLLILSINAHGAPSKDGQPKPPMKYGIFREDCYDKFFN